MKKTILRVIILSFSILILSCSSDDGNNNSDTLSQIEQKMVGSWNTSYDLKGNTYSYKSDKTAEYINTYSNGTSSVVTTYKGEWAIIDGNVLIAYYPDPDEVWDKNWKEHPTLKNKIEFIDDNTLKLTDFYDSKKVNTHYRNVVLKGSDKMHRIEFITGTLDSWVSVGLETTIDYTDRTQKVVNSNFNKTDKIISVEIPKNVTHFKLKFYIEDSSPVNMKFYAVDSNTIIHKETINKQEYQYEYTFK